jgi:starch phosphorylase
MDGVTARKRVLKEKLFALVADQTGKIFDPDILTIVWARRFAPYKRADLLTWDAAAFDALIHDEDRPIQIIWAGKPYPMDYGAISTFNKLVEVSRQHSNTAVVVHYELALSKMLKQGADIWLNTPRVTREASGTSGMTAAMNAAINFSTYDGWIPEFAHHGSNAFIVPTADLSLPVSEQDRHDLDHCYRILKEEILPCYYNDRPRWKGIMHRSMSDILPFFHSNRMAREYYEKIYR